MFLVGEQSLLVDDQNPGIRPDSAGCGHAGTRVQTVDQSRREVRRRSQRGSNKADGNAIGSVTESDLTAGAIMTEGVQVGAEMRRLPTHARIDEIPEGSAHRSR